MHLGRLHVRRDGVGEEGQLGLGGRHVGVDALEAWKRGDLDYIGPPLDKADRTYWLAAANDEDTDSLAAPPCDSLDPESSDYFRDRLTADRRAAIETWACDCAVPKDSQSHRHTKCKCTCKCTNCEGKRKAEHQLQPETAKRQRGGVSNAAGEKNVVREHGISDT